MLILVGSAIGAVLLTLFGVLAIREAGRARKAIEDAPRFGCGEAQQGPAKFFGQTRTGEPLYTPVSHTPCIYYHLAIYRQGERDRHPELVTTATHWAHDWWLEDETGALRVNTDGARVISKVSGGGVMRYEQPEEVREVLREYGVDEGFFGKTRVTEQYIAVDAPVFACGTVRGNPPELGGREQLVISVGTEATAAEVAGSGVLGYALIAGAVALMFFGYAQWEAEAETAQQQRPSAVKLKAYRE